ncbi:MAG TPA: alpha/beta hydrolase [Streptosporangiaceae bacterium]|jgi:acetyl esterase/lipase
MPTDVRPPYDAELEAALAVIQEQMPATITPEMISAMRAAPVTAPIEEVLEGRNISHREVRIPGYEGADITLSIFARNDHDAAGPGIYHTHGGGMIIGDRFTGIEVPLEWVERFDAVCVSVEYRLAPEFPDPYLVEDCYAGLVWTAGHAGELGIDPSHLIIGGGSAGGGLAAGTTLLARDRQGPRLSGQVLIYPMLDDRNQTVSANQFAGIGVWDRGSNQTGWAACLGERCGTDDVSIYAAPARATDLSGLPPTFIDVASAEVFRDEAVAYASQIWADGGVAELHVWPGGFHGFDLFAPHAQIAQAAIRTRTDWVARHLSA